MNECITSSLKIIKKEKPLIHCISNIVTANDCANLALAMGASPIMAQAPEEMADITGMANALVINTGTPSEEKFKACTAALKTASKRKIPIVLDPVGIGASPWRLKHLSSLLNAGIPSILRLNYSEALILLNQKKETSKTEHGVDTVNASAFESEQVARALAKKYGCTVLLSGPVDIVTDGTRLEIAEGGSMLTRQITGAGCMLSVICGVFASVASDTFTGALHASRFWKECAFEAEMQSADRGLGSFHMELFNAIDRKCSQY